MVINVFRKKAGQLAARPYTVVTEQSERSDETGYDWVAMNPELKGSIGQGDTEAEAIVDLAEARIEYIQSHLRRGFDVPDPSAMTEEPSESVGSGRNVR